METVHTSSSLPTMEPAVQECQRCNQKRVLTHRVKSDLLNIRVCIDCARAAFEIDGLSVEEL